MPFGTSAHRTRAEASLVRVLVLLVFLLAPTTWVSCGLGGSDPRFRVDSEAAHYTWLIKRINKSNLWQTYFEYKDPSASRILVDFHLTTERSSFKTVGGDYDPGTVTINFSVNSVASGATLFKRTERIDLPSFEIGFFPANATREEIQEAIFKKTEEALYPFLGRWVDIAAVRAMGREGGAGNVFVPLLSKLLDDDWTQNDLRGEVSRALDKIQKS